MIVHGDSDLAPTVGARFHAGVEAGLGRLQGEMASGWAGGEVAVRVP